MPVLGNLLSNLFSGLVAWLTTYFTLKVAFGVAAVTSMTGLTAGLWLLMRATVAALNAPFIGLPEFWTMVIALSIPPAAPLCISSYMTIWTACTVYTWQRDLLHLVVKV